MIKQFYVFNCALGSHVLILLNTQHFLKEIRCLIVKTSIAQCINNPNNCSTLNCVPQKDMSDMSLRSKKATHPKGNFDLNY